MSLSQKLLNEIATICSDYSLSSKLIENYNEVRNRYILGDWQPQEMNGGLFCEALSAILFNIDSKNNTGIKRSYGDNLKYLKDQDNSRIHSLENKTRKWFVQIIEATMGFRDDRGISHLSQHYTTNHLDASYVLGNVKWLMAEFIRIILKNDSELAEKLIEQIIELELPILECFEDNWYVNQSISTEKEILIHLLRITPNYLTKKQLRLWIKDKSTRMIDLSINILEKKKYINVIQDRIYLTAPGRIESEIILNKLNNFKAMNEVNL